MIDQLFSFFENLENGLWGYVAFPALMVLGFVLSFQSKFVQIRKLPAIIRIFLGFLKTNEQKSGGVHPLKAFFACVGGAVGVGNIVGICTAVQIGGPGALLWIWLAAIVGSTVKYGEVYLGIRYRIPNAEGGYHGGPMYFLQRVFRSRWIPNIVCLLLCVYGVEVYQFSVVINSVTVNLGINPLVAIFTLLFLVFFAGIGGIRRVGNISSVIIPVFVVVYVSMGLWVLFNHLADLPGVFQTVLTSAFTGHAALGGFIGSTLHMTISQGVRRACYSGDLGIGYASVIHSESSSQIPERQASLVIVDVFLDTFIICTSSVLIILATDMWHEPMEANLLVQTALGQYFPYMNYFMPFFLFLLGYSTINAYFCVGLKSAEFLSPRFGKYVYYVYAFICLLVFSFVDTSQAQMVMSLAGGALLVVNCYGIFKLRREISFNVEGQELEEAEKQAVPSVS
jgi:alanine or glycine:cation symporter, AGCS family